MNTTLIIFALRGGMGTCPACLIFVVIAVRCTTRNLVQHTSLSVGANLGTQGLYMWGVWLTVPR
jgi:hypothetical protein